MFADREDMLQSTEMARHAAEDAESASQDAILSSVGLPTDAKEERETSGTLIDDHDDASLLGAELESSGMEVVEIVEEISGN